MSPLEAGNRPGTGDARSPGTGDPNLSGAGDPGRGTGPPRLGLRANLAQFSLLVAVNALVGGMVGQERVVLPLLAEAVFGIAAFTSGLTYILAFGVTKALTNLVTGALADRYGRKPVLVAGWLIGLPVPLLLIWAPDWSWVVAANLLLGVNQGLTWSVTVIMKIDLVGPARRGLAMGLNEAAGYGTVAVTMLATGWLANAYGLRPVPFWLGIAYAALGLGLSTLAVRETHGHARHEAASMTTSPATSPAISPVATPATSRAASRAAGRAPLGEDLSTRQVFTLTSVKEPALSAASQAGMVNNLNDALAWGVLPILFATSGLPVAQVGLLAAIYPLVWGMGQTATGALSDRTGRRPLIVYGMLTQAVGLGLAAAATGFAGWAVASVFMGAGTALVYPTLLAAVGDVAHPTWRARAIGVYRLWRDAGYAVGALVAGVTADLLGLRPAVWVVAAITAASGFLAAARMYETHPRR